MRKEFVIVSCIGLLLAGIATVSLYAHPNYISNHGDINRGLIYNAIAQRDILTGKLPAWNQYVCGGMPVVGDLESWFLHPIFFLTLPFSPAVGMKIAFTLVLLSAFVGFYMLARIVLRFNIAGSALFAIILAFSGYISAHLAEGYYVWTASAYVSWFLLFAMLVLRNLKFIPLAGLMLAFMFGAGSMHLVVYSMLFVSIIFLFPVSGVKLLRRIAILLTILVFFVVLSAVKLLPAFSLLTAVSSREGFAPALTILPEMLFGRGLLGPVISAGQTMRWGEFNGYVGIGSVIIALLGGFIFRKNLFQTYKAFLIASFVMLAITFLPLPIMHGFISHIADLFRMPSRIFLFALFGMALVAGYAIDRIARTPLTPSLSQNRRGEILAWLIIIFIAADLISNDMTLFSRTFTLPVPELHAETKFQRIAHAYTTPDETYYRAIYIDYLENRGTNDVCRFYQAGPFSRAIDETDPRYVSYGEVYLQDTTAGAISYSMNNRSEYTIHANISKQTRIIINQNYYAGWVVNSGLRTENSNGIISIPVIPGEYTIVVRYAPKTIYFGLTLTLLAALLGVMIVTKKSDRTTVDTKQRTS